MDSQTERSERLRAAEAFWDRWCEVGNEGAPRGPDGALDLERAAASGASAARSVLPLLFPEARVLEIGAGVGRVLYHVAPHVREAVGVDISGRMVSESQRMLADRPNARVLHGDGCTLAGIEADSVDVVYALLCLIHADKRSAFRYLREIRRVLKPGGRALLQFQNLLSARGFELFQANLEGDFPFEFYTPEELRFLVRGAGLDVQSEAQNQEFLELTLMRGRPDGWLREWRQGFRTEILSREGFFSDQGGASTPSGKLEIALHNQTDQWRTVEVQVSIHRRAGARLSMCHFADGVAFLAPASRTEVSAQYDPSGLRLFGGEKSLWYPARRADPAPSGGRLEAHLAVIPSGLRWSEETARLFPSCAHAWTLPG